DGRASADLADLVAVPRVLAFAEVPSTLDVAHDLAARGAPAGTLVLADSQSAGRGRLGRVWRSEAGAGVWLTLIERPATSELSRGRAPWVRTNEPNSPGVMPPSAVAVESPLSASRRGSTPTALFRWTPGRAESRSVQAPSFSLTRTNLRQEKRHDPRLRRRQHGDHHRPLRGRGSAWKLADHFRRAANRRRIRCSARRAARARRIRRRPSRGRSDRLRRSVGH